MFENPTIPSIIYLDNAATTPCDEKVIEEMNIYQTKLFGNPSSPHVLGKLANLKLNECRERVLFLLGSKNGNIYFTGGATESNNIAVLSLLRYAKETLKRSRILCLSTEHKSVTNALQFFSDFVGVKVLWLPVLSNGKMDMDFFKAALTEEVGAVIVQLANSETGVIQDIEGIATKVHHVGAVLFSDITQAVGKIPINLDALQIDYASVSAHKFYGPKGVGALYVRTGFKVAPLAFGGGQENDVRPGTQNLAGIVGMVRALDIVSVGIHGQGRVLASLRNLLWDYINELDDVRWNGCSAPLLPTHLNLTIQGVYAQELLLRTRKIAFSAGSACNTSTNLPSKVLTNMGLSPTEAEQTVRLSLGKHNTLAEIEEGGALLKKFIFDIRAELR